MAKTIVATHRTRQSDTRVETAPVHRMSSIVNQIHVCQRPSTNAFLNCGSAMVCTQIYYHGNFNVTYRNTKLRQRRR
jgi:hypothetical protein